MATQLYMDIAWNKEAGFLFVSSCVSFLLSLSLSAHPGLGFLPTKIDRALRAPRLAAQGTARGILTFTEYRVPCSRMVPPCLGPEQTEQIWGDHEHGDAGVEHLVNGINELLGLRVHYLLQRP